MLSTLLFLEVCLCALPFDEECAACCLVPLKEQRAQQHAAPAVWICSLILRGGPPMFIPQNLFSCDSCWALPLSFTSPFLALVRSTCTRTCHGGLAAGMLHCCSLLPFTLVIRNPSSFIFIVWPMWVFEVKLLNRLKYAKLHLLLLLGRNPHQQDNWQSYCNAQTWCGTQVLKGCCIKILSYCLAATQQ